MGRPAIAWQEPDEDEPRDSFAPASWGDVHEGGLVVSGRRWDPELDYWDRLRRAQRRRLLGLTSTIRLVPPGQARPPLVSMAERRRLRAETIRRRREHLRSALLVATRKHAANVALSTDQIATLAGVDPADARCELPDLAAAGLVDWEGDLHLRHPRDMRWSCPCGESRAAREAREAHGAEGERLRNAHRRAVDALEIAQRRVSRAAAALAAWEARHG